MVSGLGSTGLQCRGKGVLQREGDLVGGFFVRILLLGMGLLILNKQGPMWVGILLQMHLKVCACGRKMALKAPKIYQSHSPRRFYLRSLSHLYFQEGKWFFVLQEERITDVFCHFHNLCFISFLKGA